jgi:hypothetical protein
MRPTLVELREIPTQTALMTKTVIITRRRVHRRGCFVGNTLNGRAQQSTSNTSKLPRKAAVQKRKKPETEVSGFRHHH